MEAVLEFLRGIRVGRIGTRRKPLEENRDGQESGGEGGGWAGPAASVVPFVSSGVGTRREDVLFLLLLLLLFFVYFPFPLSGGSLGKRGQRCPTRTDHLGLGQDMVM